MPDRLKQSRMLLRLDAEIATAPTQLAADCKRAERAAYLSRLGRFAEARAELGELHVRYDKWPQLEANAWVNFAEGLLAYFDNAGVSTTDKVQRAYALSAAADHRPLRALSAAWLAQWDYAALNIEALTQHLCEALQISEPQNHAARARANLVGAQALHMAGRPDLAQNWYRRSREHAQADCDDVTVSALMHNMAWLRMLSMRQAVLSGGGDLSAGRYALLNAESNSHFDDMLGDVSWQKLKPILRAQILSLQGNVGEAIGLYSAHLVSAKPAARWQANLLADKAWCQAELGQLEEARGSADLAILSFSDEVQVDDQAAAHSRLAQVFATLGDTVRGRHHQSIAAQSWAAYAVVQNKAVALIGDIDHAGHRLGAVSTRREPDAGSEPAGGRRSS